MYPEINRGASVATGSSAGPSFGLLNADAGKLSSTTRAWAGVGLSGVALRAISETT